MPSPQFQNLVETMRAQRPDVLPSIPEMRVGFDMLGRMMPVDPAVEVVQLDMGGVSSERITAPGAAADGALLYVHGGGYCLGSPDSHRHMAAKLSADVGVPVFLPDYRLAPEHPYPAALDDALAAYRWLQSKGFEASKVALAGESAGGGLLVALQVALKYAGEALPSCSVPISPWCDLADIGEVSEGALDTDWLRPEHLELFTRSYCGDADPKTALISPLYGDLEGLPPMLVQAGDHEVLFDMGRRLVDAAKSAGVDAALEAGEGMFHAWPLFTGLFPEADQSVANAAEFLRARLGV